MYIPEYTEDIYCLMGAHNAIVSRTIVTSKHDVYIHLCSETSWKIFFNLLYLFSV